MSGSYRVPEGFTLTPSETRAGNVDLSFPAKPDGSLRFDCPQAPFGPHAFDDVYGLFFRNHPDAAGTWDNLSEWLKSKSWSIRAKTW